MYISILTKYITKVNKNYEKVNILKLICFIFPRVLSILFKL